MKTLISLLTFFCMFLSFEVSFSQSVTISGYVLNEQTGKFIKSASVFEAADGIGTISNNNGFYKLILKPGEKELKFSDPGFEEFSQALALKNDTILTVKLTPADWEKSKRKTDAVFEAKKSDSASDEFENQDSK